MRNVNYYLWLQKALGPGANNTGLIFSTFSSAEEIYNMSPYERRISGVFTPLQIDRMEKNDIEDTYKIVEECSKRSVDIITFPEPDFPDLLREIQDPPVLLFVRGSLESYYDKVPIAIVGTRNDTDACRAAAQELSKIASQCGFCVVSGGAIGIDTAAHLGALRAGADTIAVLGGAIGDNYLKANEILRSVIERQGALVSEYPPFTEVYKATFPIRNRLISGMTVGTIVVEAKNVSGSLITAHHALEQGRDVMAIEWESKDLPPEKRHSSKAGNFSLLDGGAKAIKMPMDLITEYIGRFPETIKICEDVDLSIDLTKLGLPRRVQDNQIQKIYEKSEKERIAWRDRHKPLKRDIVDPLSEEAKRVYKVMPRDPISTWELSESLCMPASSLLGALTELELYGYVELLPNTKYVIK